MTRKDDARPHLDKAEEYLQAAMIVAQDHRYNAACSLAVTSAINAKDVICILSVGFTDKSDSHDKAVAELRKSGPIGAQIAPTFSKLLSRKTKAQYSAPSVGVSDALDAVKRAERVFAVAKELYDSTPR